MRAAYAIVQTDILTEGYEDANKYDGTLTNGAGKKTGYYDVAKSEMVKTKPTDTYGKSTVDGNQVTPDWPKNATFTFDGKAKGKVIKAEVTLDSGKEPTVTLSWE